MSLADMAMEQESLYTQYYRRMWADLLDSVEMVDDVELYIPWFLDCNSEHFHYWFGKEDPRNQNLLNRLKEVKHSFRFPGNKKLTGPSIFKNIFDRPKQHSKLYIC